MDTIFPRIYEWEQPNKNFEDNYKDRGFWDANHLNFPCQNACCTPMQFFVKENLGGWHPKTHGPCNYLQSFYLAALIHKCGGKNNINLLRFEILLQAEGQDHLRKKVITMELLRRLMIMKRHPNLINVLGQISIPTSMHLCTGDVKSW